LLNEAYHFSISHCGDYAAAMVSSTQRVGVDVEMITPKVAKVKDKFLSIDEQQILAALAHPWDHLPEPAMLMAAWSIKESLFKWYGEGLIDFKDHLRIDALQVNGDKGLAHCSLLKNNAIEIDAQFIFLDDHCLCWVANG
jgi:phosphopantetheinyl transferase